MATIVTHNFRPTTNEKEYLLIATVGATQWTTLIDAEDDCAAIEHAEWLQCEFAAHAEIQVIVPGNKDYGVGDLLIATV